MVCLALLCLAAVSCASKQERFLSDLRGFVSDVKAESEAGNLSTADWDRLDEEIRNYYNEYKELSNDFTSEQKKEVGKLFTQYVELRLASVGDAVESYGDLFKGVLDELGDSFEGVAEELGKSLGDLSNELNSTLEDIDGSVGEFLDAFGDE